MINDNNMIMKVHNKLAQSLAKTGRYSQAVASLKRSLQCVAAANLAKETRLAVIGGAL